MSGTTGFNNGYPFTITDPTADETSLTNSFGSLMADPSGVPSSTSGTFLGLNAKDWAGGLKDIGSGLKGAAVSPQGSAAQRPATAGSAAAAAAHTGQAGGLGTLLQLLAQRANMFNQAAHQGAVPTPTRPGGGLLGL